MINFPGSAPGILTLLNTTAVCTKAKTEMYRRSERLLQDGQFITVAKLPFKKSDDVKVALDAEFAELFASGSPTSCLIQVHSPAASILTQQTIIATNVTNDSILLESAFYPLSGDGSRSDLSPVKPSKSSTGRQRDASVTHRTSKRRGSLSDSSNAISSSSKRSKLDTNRATSTLKDDDDSLAQLLLPLVKDDVEDVEDVPLSLTKSLCESGPQRATRTTATPSD